MDNMNFKDLLDKLNSGYTIEDISLELCVDVEAFKNFVYLDDDLHTFLSMFGASITDIEFGYVIIDTDEEMYKVPCEELPNRFDNTLPYETMICFNRITEIAWEIT